MKRFVFVVFSMVMAFGMGMSAAPSASAASWADPYLQNLVQREVMRGDISGNLNPDRNITRSEFAAMLNRAFGFSARGNKTFKDVPSTAWFATDIDIAAFQGFMQGDGKGINPYGNLTREEAVTMLCRSLKIAPQEGEGFQLTDERNFSNWSRGYINAAVEKNFVSGYPDGSFQPTNRITRGEAAKLLSSVAGEIVTSQRGNVSGIIDGNATLTSSGSTLSNATVLGDLYLTEGVGLGYVTLKNVTVNGDQVISGAGESNVGQSSVILTDCNISNLIVDVAKQKILTLKTDKSTVVENTLIKSSTYLEELSNNFEGFKNVNLKGPSGTFLNLTGSFGDVKIMSPGSVLNVYKGKVNALTVDETAKGAKIFLEKDTYTTAMYFDTGATVTGKGQIESVLINNDGVVIEQLPENIYIRPGVTAKINGKVMGSLDAEMDALKPDFSYGYPKADKIQPTSFAQYYMTNKPGKVYYAVYPAGTNMPSKDDLLAKNAPPKNALKSGNLSALPDKESTTTISGLKPGEKYTVYSFFMDLRGASSDIKSTDVQAVDNVIPTLLSGYPKVSSTTSTSATFTLIPNKNSSYYWAVLPANAVAPTASQLYTQTISGTRSKGVTYGGVMNTPKEIDTATGGTLEEYASYVFYVVLRDASDNMSSTPYKLPFTTKDSKPPEFKPNDGTYPKVGSVAATSIPLTYVVNEPCTVYWAAVKMGTNLLPLASDGKPDLSNQKSKDVVKTGSGAWKYGSSSASKEGQLYTISVSGLEQQMPYDIYFMLEDKSGNQSNITKITAKTKDIVPPTVGLSSEQEIGGNYSVDASVKLTFSEIVCGSKTDKDGNYLTLSQLFQEDKSALKNYITLVDASKVPNAAVTIDWNYVTVEEKDAKTLITFKPEAIRLTNNNSYRFELNNQVNYAMYDTSKNAMKGTVTLPFKTVPPLTYFSEVQNFDSSKYDTAFFINPRAKNTGPNIYFDLLLRSDHYLEFELYQGTSIDSLQPVLKNGVNKFVLPDNYATRLTDYLTTKTEYQNLEDLYYAIKITKIDTTPITGGQIPITANVNLTLNAVIGNETGIRQLPGTGSTFDTRLKEAIKNNYVSSVTAPTDPFLLRIALVDNVPPAKVGETKFEPGDRQVLMSVQATKGCTVYYYAVPEAIAPATITDPNIVRSQRSDSKQGTAAGSFQISDNNAAPTQYTIEGLLPPNTGDSNRKYVIYYYLQGKASTPSEVYKGDFATTPVKAPKIVQKLEAFADNNLVKITGSWDSDCRMYYVIYPANSAEPTIDQIMGKEPSNNQITSGSITVKADTVFKLDINGIDYKYRYDFYAVAQKYIGTAPAGDSSTKEVLRGFTSRDNEAPDVLYDRPETVISTMSADGLRFDGSVMVQFTEGLYFFKQGSSDTQPLLENDLINNLKGNWVAPANVQYVNSSQAGTDGAIQQVTFSFSQISDGTTITFGQDIGDKTGNRSGQFKMTFHSKDDQGVLLPKPYWQAEFLR